MRRWILISATFVICCAAIVTTIGAKDFLRSVVIATTTTVPPSGIYSVGTSTVLLPSVSGEHTPDISVRIWYPVDASSEAPRHHTGALALVKAHQNAPLATLPNQFPVVLYAPSWASKRDDNTVRTANLASHGYVVVAFDDVAHDPENTTGPEGPDRTSGIDFTSAESYARTRPLADARVAREARKASLILDRLTADAQWGQRLALSRVGFVGFSFGGAAAAETALSDQRIVAVVNLDGWVFGEALRKGVKCPYLVFWSDTQLYYSDPSVTEAERRMSRDYERYEQQQLLLPHKYGFMISGVTHLDFTDRTAYRDLEYKFDRVQIRNAVDAYLLDFLGVYLHGRQPTLLLGPPPIPQLREIKSMAPSPAGNASAPT